MTALLAAKFLFAWGNLKHDVEAVGGFLSRHSIWLTVSLCLCLAWGVDHIICHRHAAHVEKQLARLEAANDDARSQVTKADTQIAALTKQLKDAKDAQSRAIADDARSLRVSGPGKSRCAAVPASADNGASPAKPDAAGPSLPPTDSAAVPWDWLTTRAEEHDQLLNEVTAWRAWHDQVLKSWPNTEAAH
jgi:hypothetical protein